MFKKLGVLAVLAGVLLTLSSPMSALAAEHGRGNSGRGYYGGRGSVGRGYSSRSYGGRGYYGGRDFDRGRGDRRWEGYGRYYGPRGYAFGFYGAPYAWGGYYGPGYCGGYYDRWGYWHSYPCYAAPWGY